MTEEIVGSSAPERRTDLKGFMSVRNGALMISLFLDEIEDSYVDEKGRKRAVLFVNKAGVEEMLAGKKKFVSIVKFKD